MKLNRLLEKQLRRVFPEGVGDNAKLAEFVNFVNNSYNAYERDLELSERAFRIAEDEYREVNGQLKQEVELKKASIRKLNEAVAEAGAINTNENIDENELLNIASYLKSQITRQREAEKELQEQKRFYEQILNFIPADLAIVDKWQRYLFVNPSAVKDARIREWIIGKTDEQYRLYKNKPVAASDERRQYFEKAVQSKAQVSWEEKVEGKNGNTEYHLRVLFPVFDEAGELSIMIIYGFNITERKKNEEQIRLSEERYRSIFDNSQAMICTHDLNGKILDTNKAALVTLGYSKEELVGAPLAQLLQQDKRPQFEEHYLGEIKTKGSAEGIMLAISKDGKRKYLLYQNYLVQDSGDPYVIGFSQDITARIEAERALKKSEEKYRSIIENMNLGLLQVDTQERIVYANQSFCDMTGFEISEVIGGSAPDLLLREQQRVDTTSIIERRKNGVSDAYELQIRNKRGELKWCLISGAPLLDDSGNFLGSIGIHLDITRQKTLEQELRQAKADADNSAHAKELFLTNMSHEIRTPMNAIIGIGNQLAKTTLQPQQRFFLDTIRNASANLLVIINDLLDFSKIEAGKVSLEYIGFNLGDMLENAVQILKHKAEEKGLTLDYRFDKAVAPVLIGDPYRINQILMNLLSNSIKFTENGKVSINCTIEKNEAKSQRLLFTVTDTGIGMSEEFLKHLFVSFSQEDESITRKFGGTGLGMSISKQLIELMGGQIHVESKKNHGTSISFSITCPIGAWDDLPEAWDTQADTNILKGKRLLLVEDNSINRLLATMVLTQYGAEVVEAEDGSVAIAKFAPGQFDMILMDVQMPVKNGLETTEYIREHLDKVIPIIALTANAFKQEEERCLQAGMNDFISKPFDEDKMIRLISQWLGKVVTTTTGPSSKAPQKTATKLYDLNKVRAVSRGDDAFVKRIMELFIEDIPGNIRQMEQRCEEKNWAGLAAIAHKIRPSVHNLGMNTLADELHVIELTKPDQADELVLTQALERIADIVKETADQFKKELGI